ncbi:hypothetical protein, partial [Flavobacterium columnare]|uniref:hypothetical protein n=1 Tax=Flavobacterium columnare TaxID=996 RepID=UPI001C995077
RTLRHIAPRRSSSSASCVAGFDALPQHRHIAPRKQKKALYNSLSITLFLFTAVLGGVIVEP